ncbi:MAG: insulinase family protein, partial [Bacteroidales bacterium]|nr:insulinase family protein [Bacteroidales bacterium]
MKTGEDYLRNLSYSCFSGMLNQRLQERTQEADPPFVYAGVGYGGFLARSTDAYSAYALVSDSKVESGLEAVMIENERVLRHGFTQGELDRFKLNLLKSYERSYAERDKTESGKIVDEYIRHYLEEEAIPGIEFEFEFVKNNIDKIKLEDINKLGKQFITEENKVILVTGPDKIADGLNEDQLLAVSKKVSALDIKPYEDNLANSELIKEMPKAGGIKSTEKIESIEVEKITLSNGVEVYLKKTDFKNDEILLNGFSKGGTSVYPDEDFYTAMYTSSILSESGVSDFSKTDLKKLLAGKSAGIGVGINKYDEVVSGSCRPQDVETMFQLLYLKFTNPRKDDQAYQSYVNKMKAYIANINKNPQSVYSDKYARIKYQNHKRGEYMPLVEDFDKINHDRAMEIYQDRFADANDFIFVVVGNFDEKKLKDMLSTYVATLPVKDGDESYVDLGIRPPKGLNEHAVYKGEDPKSMTQVYFEKEAEYSKEDAFMLQAFSTVLNIKFIEKLREEMSGVYSVRATAGFGRIPYGYANMTFKIPSSPGNVDSLVNAGLMIVKDIQENGVSNEDIVKVQN